MAAGKILSSWVSIAILLAAIIATGSVITWSRYSRSQSIEISLMPEREFRGEIYVSGEVENPGFYPLEAGDDFEDIVQAAGGSNQADLTHLELYVPGLIGGESPQKVDINHAEAWLLEALPGIGEVRAQAIIDYRQKNGPFRDIKELVKVEGIGWDTYENIKHLLTVGD
jgi:competence protein ComEA